jgi:hypothetical protein
MIMVRLLSTRAFMVGLAPPSLLGLGAGIVMESITLKTPDKGVSECNGDVSPIIRPRLLELEEL